MKQPAVSRTNKDTTRWIPPGERLALLVCSMNRVDRRAWARKQPKSIRRVVIRP